MEFWGVEVKSGETLKVQPGDNKVLHLSQASLGVAKKDKGNESALLFLNIDEKKIVLGTLFTEKLPQQQLDLVFEKDFELSHNWKNGSIYFYGYKADNPFNDGPQEEGSDESDEEEEEEALPVVNVKPKADAKPGKPAEAVKAVASKGKESVAGKQKVKIVEPSKDANAEDDDESSEDLMSEDDDDSEDEDDSDDSESGESDEETPKKPESSKKRASESAIRTPVQDKKAKATPQKTDGKKVSGHVATPYPSKQAGKTPATKPNQTPPSGGAVSCKSCSKGFGSEKALESHTKAKHSAQK